MCSYPLNLFCSLPRCQEPDFSAESGGTAGEGLRLAGGILPQPVRGRAGPLRQAATETAGATLHRPQVSGTPFLLQAHRRHPHRHLLNGDAGSAQ